jgi:hypothetical protein
MSVTVSNRTITAWAAALLTAVPPVAAGTALSLGTTADAAGRPSSTVRQQLAATRYWTPARMRAALKNAWSNGDTLGSGLRWTHGGAVARAAGKVFFTLDRADYVCSGAVVAGRGQDVVLTAAHCTGNGPRDQAANWMFVPGYADGAAPYGSYPAHRFYVSPRWADQRGGASAAAERYDVAFVTMNPSPVTGQRVGQAVGGLPVAFGSGSLGGRDTYVFGYPSDPPFGGQDQDFCAGRASPAADGPADGTPAGTAAGTGDGAAAVACGMTAGDSGGPWLAGFSPQAGTGTVVAVSTYKYTDGARMLYGTRLGPYARSLYDAASGVSRVRRSGGPARSRRPSARRRSA